MSTSTINHVTIAERLTTDRLRSYLAASGGDLALAIELYDWNARIGGALHEDIGRIEVVFRNPLDAALGAYGAANGWPVVWYGRAALFPGRHGRRALDDIAAARSRAARRGVVETHGKVIAELTFGFWRFLCTAPYLTSLWVPALADTFPNHPHAGDPRIVRADVEDRIQRVHFLRNRIAHHEPVHHRDLQRDHDSVLELAGWLCHDTLSWMTESSRTRAVLSLKP